MTYDKKKLQYLFDDEIEEGSRGLKRQLRKKVSSGKKMTKMPSKEVQWRYKDAFNVAQKMNKEGGGTVTVYHMVHPDRLNMKTSFEDVFKFLHSKSPKEISVSVEKGVWDFKRSIILVGEGKLTSYFPTDVYTDIDDYGNKVPLEPYRDKDSHNWDEGTVRLSDVEWEDVVVGEDFIDNWSRGDYEEIERLADEYDLTFMDEWQAQGRMGGAMASSMGWEDDIKNAEEELFNIIGGMLDKYQQAENYFENNRDEMSEENAEKIESHLEDLYDKVPGDVTEYYVDRMGRSHEEVYDEYKREIENSEELDRAIADVQEMVDTAVEEHEEEGELVERSAVAQSDQFKNWFGDSKVVDKNGEPRVMYHGTKSDKHFSVFSVDGVPVVVDDDADEEVISDRGSVDPNTYMGAHFAQEPYVADKFAAADQDWLKNRYTNDNKDGGRVYPVYLKITNPISFKNESVMEDLIYSIDMSHEDQVDAAVGDMAYHEEKDVDEMWELYETSEKDRIRLNQYAMSLSREIDNGEYGGDATTDLAQAFGHAARKKLLDMGYDGVRYKNDVEGGISWIAFFPNQIKSALGSGFTDDPDITKENFAKIAFLEKRVV